MKSSLCFVSDCRGFSFTALFFAFLVLSWTGASAAPLSVGDEAKMAGKWFVNGGNVPRVYEITTGHNIRIEGGGRGDRRGRLAVQADGAYLFKLEDDSNLRLTYTPVNDELIVQYYKGKKDFELGLKPMWTTKATRKTD